jgi:hypothetical protein
MESFLTSRIAADDPKLKDCYRHFQANLGDIVQTARRCGAGVLLCTVPTNIRSCAPFGSQHQAGLAAESVAQWDQAFQEGRSLERAGDGTGALSAYEGPPDRQLLCGSDVSHGRMPGSLGKTDEARACSAAGTRTCALRADSSILRHTQLLTEAAR